MKLRELLGGRTEWRLVAMSGKHKTIIASGTRKATGTTIPLKLVLKGASATVFVDAAQVAVEAAIASTHGMYGLQTGWNTASFDTFAYNP